MSNSTSATDLSTTNQSNNNNNNNNRKLSSPRDSEEQLENYKIKIEAIFDHEESRELFRKFLKQNYNEEPFLFYEMVEKYQKIRLDLNRLQLAEQIIEQFIIVNAKYEVNLSQQIRNEILQNWNKIIEKNKNKDEDLMECPLQLFNFAQNVIFTNLKEDNFVRFLQWEGFKKFVQENLKKNENFLQLIGTKRKNLQKQSSFDENEMPNDLESTLQNLQQQQNDNSLKPFGDASSIYITKKDLEITKDLINNFNENDWKILQEEIDLKMMISKQLYYFGDKQRPTFLIHFEGFCQGSPKEVMYFHCSQDMQENFDKVFKKRYQMGYLHKDEKKGIDYPITFLYSHLKLHFPLSNREFVYAKSVIPEGKVVEEEDDYENYYIIQKPSVHDDCPLNKKNVRGNHYFVFYSQRKSQTLSKFGLFAFIDMKGNVPLKLSSKVLGKIMASKKKEFQTILKQVEKDKKEGKKRYSSESVKDFDGTLMTLKENLDILKKQQELNSVEKKE
ncbi:hypothetical protein ABK040_010692 [Willaertia magna]